MSPLISTPKSSLRYQSVLNSANKAVNNQVADFVNNSSFTEKTSIQLVKNFMSAAIGSLSFLRELFSDDNFIDDTFQVPHPVNTKPNIVRIKRLKRGVSEPADTLISWLVSFCLKISVVTYTDFL